MKECPRCHKYLPDDSEFCQYCGYSLNGKQTAEETPANVLKENPRKNEIGRYAVLLMIFTVLAFDFVLGTLFNGLQWNVKIVYYISTALYVVSILLALFSLYIDHVDRKNGYLPSKHQNLAMTAIVFSLLIMLLNYRYVLSK